VCLKGLKRAARILHRQNPRDLRLELRADGQRTGQEMKALLDESQEALYQEMRREEWREEHPHGGESAGRADGQQQ
jgi:hypothetical protein